MSKYGATYFRALGQSDASRGLRVRRAAINQSPGCWPYFAKYAYHLGYWLQKIDAPRLVEIRKGPQP